MQQLLSIFLSILIAFSWITPIHAEEESRGNFSGEATFSDAERKVYLRRSGVAPLGSQGSPAVVAPPQAPSPEVRAISEEANQKRQEVLNAAREEAREIREVIVEPVERREAMESLRLETQQAILQINQEEREAKAEIKGEIKEERKEVIREAKAEFKEEKRAIIAEAKAEIKEAREAKKEIIADAKAKPKKKVKKAKAKKNKTAKKLKKKKRLQREKALKAKQKAKKQKKKKNAA